MINLPTQNRIAVAVVAEPHEASHAVSASPVRVASDHFASFLPHGHLQFFCHTKRRANDWTRRFGFYWPRFGFSSCQCVQQVEAIKGFWFRLPLSKQSLKKMIALRWLKRIITHGSLFHGSRFRVRKGEAGKDLELHRAKRLRAVRFGFHAILDSDRKLALRP
jgi:hypothetical protein